MVTSSAGYEYEFLLQEKIEELGIPFLGEQLKFFGCVV